MRWNEESWKDVAEVLGFSSEEEMLRHLYMIQKFSINQISRIVGYTSFSVRRRLIMLNVSLRPRGGPNGKGKRTLIHLPDEVLYGMPAEKLAGQLQCHPSTVYAEKRLRNKSEKEKQLNDLLSTMPSEIDSRDGGDNASSRNDQDSSYGTSPTSEESTLSGSDEESLGNGRGSHS